MDSMAWPDGAMLGGGFNQILCRDGGLCLANVPEEGALVASGPALGLSSRFELQLIESSQQLAAELGVSASFAVQAGAADVDASASFVARHACDQNSVYMLCSVVLQAAPVVMQAGDIAELTLAADALTLLKNRPLDFLDRFGDSFIKGWVNGARLQLIFALQTHSLVDHKNLSVAVKGGAGSYSAAAQFKGEIQQITGGRSVSVYRVQQGGPALAIGNLELDDAVAAVDKFVAEVHANPAGRWRSTALLMPYRGLSGLAGIDFGSVDGLLAERENVARVILEVRDASASLEYVASYGEQFASQLGVTDLQTRREALRKALDTLQQRFAELGRQTKLDEPPASIDEVRRWDGVATALAMQKALPARLSRLPACAEDIRTMFRNPTTLADPPEGDYTLFLDPMDATSGVTLYCTFRPGGARSYLTLVQFADDANVSIWPASSDGRWMSGTTLTTRYRRIAFDPRTRIVDCHDATFATTTPPGASLSEHGADGSNCGTYLFAPYGIARASNNATNRAPFSYTSVDLTGTEFQIDESVAWVGALASISWDYQQGDCAQPCARTGWKTAHMSVGGAPGSLLPSPHLVLRRSDRR